MNASSCDNPILQLRGRLTEKYVHARDAINVSAPLLPPLVDIITGYVTTDPKIADVLCAFDQRAACNANHKLIWRVKHRDAPSGPDVAEVSLARAPYMADMRFGHEIIPSITIGLFRIDRHDGETLHAYTYYLSCASLYNTHPESDGLTVRLNAREAEYSSDVVYDMNAIALVELHRMIGRADKVCDICM